MSDPFVKGGKTAEGADGASRRARRGPARTMACAFLLLAPILTGSPSTAMPVTGEGSITKASGRCGVCHPGDRVAFEKSLHAAEELHCTSCHGGNDQAVDQKTAHSGTWRGRIPRADVPKLCGSCHSDARRMQPYDLPVDQLALYETSVHGRKLRQGDPRVATCSDCHGPHEVLAASDPASRTYITNIARTCGGCHGDSALVRARGIRDTYHDYLSSIHARELLDRGNLGAPTCTSCHGVHGAVPPEVGNIHTVCGRCHTAERRYFLSGPHASGMSRKAMAECSSCHGDHGTKRSNTANLAATCVDCHARDSRSAQLGVTLLADYESARREIDGAERWVVRADAVPIPTDDFKARVEEARTYLREAMTAAHAVRPEVMAGFTVRARSMGAEVSEEIEHELKNIRVEKLALVVFWFYVLVTVGILRRFRNARPQDA